MPVYFTVPTYFSLKPIFISFPFSFPFHISLPSPTSYSVIPSLPLTMPLSRCSQLPLPVYRFSSSSLLFNIDFFSSLLLSFGMHFLSVFSFLAFAPVFYSSLSDVSHVSIPSLSPILHFLFSSADLLYLCFLAVISVGCSYLNLTLILHMELLSKHQRKEGIQEQNEISGGSAKEQSQQVYIKSRVNLLSKVTSVCK